LWREKHVTPPRKTEPVQKPSLGALLLALIPFLALCFTVPLWDRVHPILLGLPFNLFWLISWIPLTTLCMWAAYSWDRKAESADSKNAQGDS
jgi:hypothetical protein